MNPLGRFVTPPGRLLPRRTGSETGHADSITEERREEFLNLIPPAIYLVTSSTLSTVRKTGSQSMASILG
jgi:hypothetical protein